LQLVTAWTCLEFTGECCRPRVGPYYGIVERLAGLDIPNDSGFSLVGDADCFDAVFGVTVLLEYLEGTFDAVLNRLDNLVWIVFVPTTES
jgi:hypothetical protein